MDCATFDLRLAGEPGAYTVEVLDAPAGQPGDVQPASTYGREQTATGDRTTPCAGCASAPAVPAHWDKLWETVCDNLW